MNDSMHGSGQADRDTLPVMETFYSLQGEGFHTGKPAFFIRIGGCDVGCRWCDSKESWDAAVHPLMPVETILRQALSFPARAVVVTGGEPLQYPLGFLCQSLKDLGFERYLETSGSCKLSGAWEWICLSPKPNAFPMPDVIQHANELKIIVSGQEGFLWAEQMASLVGPDCHLFLQAEWSQRNNITPAIVSFILAHPRWRISQQSHKYLRIP